MANTCVTNEQLTPLAVVAFHARPNENYALCRCMPENGVKITHSMNISMLQSYCQ